MHLPLDLPARPEKPRPSGLTVLIDRGLPTGAFAELLGSHRAYVDHVKLGWCTGLVTADLRLKFDIAGSYGVDLFFGGTLFEKCLVQGRLAEYRQFCHERGCRRVEISSGTIDLPNAEKAKHIREFARSFAVFSEVGFKDPQRAARLAPETWAEYVQEDLEAGAAKVILESRESGRSGICDPEGRLREDVLDAILEAGVPHERLIFEAPTKALQVQLIKKLGANVNLANIAADDVLALETLRLGLRSDTLLLFEDSAASASASAPSGGQPHHGRAA